MGSHWVTHCPTVIATGHQRRKCKGLSFCVGEAPGSLSTNAKWLLDIKKKKYRTVFFYPWVGFPNVTHCPILSTRLHNGCLWQLDETTFVFLRGSGQCSSREISSSLEVKIWWTQQTKMGQCVTTKLFIRVLCKSDCDSITVSLQHNSKKHLSPGQLLRIVQQINWYQVLHLIYENC